MTATLPAPPDGPSPYHAGERALQARAGVREQAERAGRRSIRPVMTEQHQRFFADLPFVVVGSIDSDGAPWASILTGPPGFLAAPDPARLEIAARPAPGDPLGGNLRPGAPLAFLGIQLETRRRNRLNGRIAALGDGTFSVAVDQSFGNCPQYIQARTIHAAPSTGTAIEPEGPGLSAAAERLIRNADTFFIASVSPGAASGSDRAEGVDVSHRGGRPGFVRVIREAGRSVLTVPDFRGNGFFNTLGNILAVPRAGVLFVDFASGDLLFLTGTAEVDFESPEIGGFAAAERLLHLRVERGHRLPGALALRGSAPQPAARIAATGTWGADHASGS